MGSLALTLLTALVITIVVAISSISINSVVIPNNKIKTFIFQEKIISEAVNSYCLSNFTVCQEGIHSRITITKTNLSGYYPVNLDFSFPGTIDINSSSINLVEDTQSNYTENYLNSKAKLICQNGENLPCTGKIIKQFDLSFELNKKFISYQITDLQNQKLIAEDNSNPDMILINRLQSEIDSNTTLYNYQNTLISNRKIKAFRAN